MKIKEIEALIEPLFGNLDDWREGELNPYAREYGRYIHKSGISLVISYELNDEFGKAKEEVVIEVDGDLRRSLSESFIEIYRTKVLSIKRAIKAEISERKFGEKLKQLLEL